MPALAVATAAVKMAVSPAAPPGRAAHPAPAASRDGILENHVQGQGINLPLPHHE